MGIREFAISKLGGYTEEQTMYVGEVLSKSYGSEYEKGFYEPYNPAGLFQKDANYTTYDKMRTDDQVGALLKFKKYMIIGAGYDINAESETEQDKKADDEIIDFAYYNLEKFLNKSFEQALMEILLAIDYGWSWTEICYELIPSGRWSGKVGLKKLNTRPPHGVLLGQDESGDLEYIKQDEVKFEGNVLDKFLVYTHDTEFGNPYGTSDLTLGVYRAWFSKNIIIKFWNMYLERFGHPLPVAKYDPKATVADRGKIGDILKNMQARTHLVVPKDWELELAEVKGNTEGGFEKAIDKHNGAIGRAMLVPDLMGLAGGATKGGSFALGQEQFDAFYQTIEKMRLDLARVINQRIMQPLIRYNFTNSEENTIEFSFKPLREEDKKEAAKIWIDAAKGRVFSPNDEEINHLRSLLNFPEGEVAESPKPEMPPGFGKPEGKEGEDEDEDKDDKDKELADGLGRQPGGKAQGPGGQCICSECGHAIKHTIAEPCNKIKCSKCGGAMTRKIIDHKELTEKFTRATTSYEKKVNLTEIDRKTKSIEKGTTIRLADVIQTSLNDMIMSIQNKKMLENKRLDVATNPEFKYRNKFKAILKESSKETMRFGYSKAKNEVQKRFSIVDDTGGLTKKEANTFLDEIAEYVSHTEWENMKKISTPILQNGIQAGKSYSEIMAELDKAFSVYDITLDAHRLENIVRTNGSRVFNEGRRIAFKEDADLIKSYQFSAILDGRTSDICIEMDQKIFRTSEADNYQPPLHYMCRSILVPIVEGEDFELSDMPATENVGGSFLKLK